MPIGKRMMKGFERGSRYEWRKLRNNLESEDKIELQSQIIYTEEY